MKQKEISEKLRYSSSTLQRYRQDIKMQSPYESNNPEKRQTTSNDLKRPQMTSEDTNEIDISVSKKVKTKIKLKGGDPNEDSINGRDPIEQAFSSN